jgi:hypothetical protein
MRTAPQLLLRSAEVALSLLLGDSCKRLDCSRVGRDHVTFTVSQWRHTGTRDVNNNRRRCFPAKSDQRDLSWSQFELELVQITKFVGSSVILWILQVWCEDFMCAVAQWYLKWYSETLWFLCSSYVTRRGLVCVYVCVCATVNYEVWKWTIALYDLYVNVIKNECVT